MARKKLGNIEWDEYEGYACRNVSIDDSIKNEKVVQFYPISKSAGDCVSEHVVIDKLGNIVHYGLHGFGRTDFVSTFGIEIDQRMLLDCIFLKPSHSFSFWSVISGAHLQE